MIRRVVTGQGDNDTAGGQWAIRGYETPGTDEGDGDDPVDVFGGLHIYARPATTDDAEALVLHVGAEAEHPAIGALRNEDARRRYVDAFGDLAAGETAIFNSLGTTRIHISAAGEIQIEVASGEEILLRSDGGTAVELATKQDVQDVKDAIAGAAVAAGDGGATFKANIATGLVGVPAGTTVLKGE